LGHAKETLKRKRRFKRNEELAAFLGGPESKIKLERLVGGEPGQE